MADTSIGSISSGTSAQRPQASAQSTSARSGVTVLGPAKTPAKAASSLNRVALAIPQNAGSSSSRTKIPRGSLVDELA